jgi:hypothetical protein
VVPAFLCTHPGELVRQDQPMAEDRVLTEAQAYEAAFRFVVQYRERERQPGPESLDLMLVHMEPVADHAQTNDPAAWSDWQRCVEETLRGDPVPKFSD